MSHKNRNPVFSASIEAINRAVIDAGTRRDGSGLARCQTAIEILAAMRRAIPDGQIAGRAEMSEIYDRAVLTAFYCAIHDQYARGEIDGNAYGEALKSARQTYSDNFDRISPATAR